MREANTRAGRLDQIRAAVRDWKSGTISAPEAIARVARAVDVTLVESVEPGFANVIDAYDERLGFRAVTHRAPGMSGKNTETLTLECGHIVERVAVTPALAAARVQCVDCIQEVIDEKRSAK